MKLSIIVTKSFWFYCITTYSVFIVSFPTIHIHLIWWNHTYEAILCSLEDWKQYSPQYPTSGRKCLARIASSFVWGFVFIVSWDHFPPQPTYVSFHPLVLYVNIEWPTSGNGHGSSIPLITFPSINCLNCKDKNFIGSCPSGNLNIRLINATFFSRLFRRADNTSLHC